MLQKCFIVRTVNYQANPDRGREKETMNSRQTIDEGREIKSYPIITEGAHKRLITKARFAN